MTDIETRFPCRPAPQSSHNTVHASPQYILYCHEQYRVILRPVADPAAVYKTYHGKSSS